jgi:hypothetical protein
MSEALVIIDHRKAQTATIYTQPSKQILIMKELFLEAVDIKKTNRGLSCLHKKLEYEIDDNDLSDSESESESDDECTHCVHSNRSCKSKHAEEEWSYQDKIARCKELIEQFESEQSNPTAEDWVNLANECELKLELNDLVHYHLAKII